jgi:hypothetical protein
MFNYYQVLSKIIKKYNFIKFLILNNTFIRVNKILLSNIYYVCLAINLCTN